MISVPVHTETTTGRRSAGSTNALAADIIEFRTAPEERRGLGTAGSLYCRWLETDPNLAEATRKAYRRDVLDFVDAMADHEVHLLSEVESEDVELWKHSLDGLEPSSISRKLTAVAEFFKWAMTWKLVAHNPVSAVRRPRKRRKEPVYLPLQHFERLMAACHNARERAVLGCLFWAGCRRQEVARLRISSVDLEGRRVRVAGKGGHVRDVPICHNLMALLDEHLKGIDRSDPDAPLFSNREQRPLGVRCVNRWFARWCREAGLASRGYTPHSARHGAGPLLGVNGFSGFEISKYLGHNDPRTTFHYVHSSTEALRQKLDELTVYGRADGVEPEAAGLEELRDEIGQLKSAVTQLVSVFGAGRNDLPQCPGDLQETGHPEGDG